MYPASDKTQAEQFLQDASPAIYKAVKALQDGDPEEAYEYLEDAVEDIRRVMAWLEDQI